MDARLEGYVIRQFAQLPNTSKQDFLKTLKYKPDIVTNIIADNFDEWSLLAVFESRDPIGQIGGCLFISDDQQTCAELTECLKQHFAKELTELPDNP